MKSLMSTAVAALAGAAAMYYLDREQGPRRRAAARDQWRAGSDDARTFIEQKRKYLMDQARSLASSVGGKAGDGESSTGSQAANDAAPANDDQLIEAVRRRISEVTGHPGAIKISVSEGCVRLGGHALSREVDALVAAAAKVPGVSEVDNQISVHDEPGNIPALQGGS